ncbi:MAG: helix-turn-helix transcriptional regulator [Clostridia bacterium]|nr:helix-turn-helix transcriptional regulator [Clostridia bacterium]
MNLNSLSPYIRVAMHSTLRAPFVIRERVIFDYEMIFVKNGKCRININGTDYICKKNNVVLLRPGIPHSFNSMNNEDFVQPHFHFDMMYSGKSAERSVSFKNIDEMTEHEKSLIQDDIIKHSKIPFVFTPENLSEFQNIFFRIIDIYSEKKPYSELLYKSEFLKLIYLIISQFEHNYQSINEKADIKLIKDYIDGNFRQNISLDFLASQFYINKFTMMRRFKEVYGKNIIKYCNEKKLQEAEKLLKNTNLSVKAIGVILNFTDAYSFSRFFKNEFGISPAEYRKRAEN